MTENKNAVLRLQKSVDRLLCIAAGEPEPEVNLSQAAETLNEFLAIEEHVKLTPNYDALVRCPTSCYLDQHIPRVCSLSQTYEFNLVSNVLSQNGVFMAKAFYYSGISLRTVFCLQLNLDLYHWELLFKNVYKNFKDVNILAELIYRLHHRKSTNS